MALPIANPAAVWGQSEDDMEIVKVLQTYKREADMARKGGPNPRDAAWERNLNLYWNRYDFSGKASWQAKEVMPEVPSYVDRFAAAMKEALVATPEGFFSVSDPYDQENDIADSIKRMMDVWLSTIGRNQQGSILAFPAVFEEQMKLGALTATSAVVLWKDDVKGKPGRVAMETVDPRNVWLDPTYRNLYRIRRTEVDKYDLLNMAKAQTRGGKPVFNIPQIEALVSSIVIEETAQRELMAGHGAEIIADRKPVVLDEYIATVVGTDGRLLAENALMVVANNEFLIRGPETNPFWHGQDWLVFAPLVTAPLSVYGRSYMEDFGSIANMFTELTNLILDAARTASMNAYAMVPSMLLNPKQAAEGLHPNKVFLLEDGYDVQDFAKELALGKLDPSAIQVWQNLKGELSEAAGINEIGLGQFAPKGRTSATEINSTQANSSALVRSVAQTVETRFLDLSLDRVWKTGVQHASTTDRALAEAAGPQLYQALMGRRKELVSRPITFQARGISSLIARNQMLSQLMQLMQVIASNELLLQAFMQQIDVNKLLALLFRLSNVDITKMQASARDKLIAQIMGPMQQAGGQGGGQAPAPAMQEMGDVARSMGVAQ